MIHLKTNKPKNKAVRVPKPVTKGRRRDRSQLEKDWIRGEKDSIVLKPQQTTLGLRKTEPE